MSNNTSSIESRVYKIFNDWVMNAKKEYPDLNYQIANVSKFENEFDNVLDNAKQELLNDNVAKRFRNPGFDCGYIDGCIKRDLETLWKNEFIKKHTFVDEYPKFLSALDTYFTIEEVRDLLNSKEIL